MTLYDSADKYDIYEYSKKMIGKTFNEIFDEDSIVISESGERYDYANINRKGGLGQLVEEKFFHYKSNSDSDPDFKEAGLELKVTPYKINKNGKKVSKERLTLGMIDYNRLIKEDFYESHVWYKNKNILLIYYLWRKELEDRLDYRVDYSYLYTPPMEDLEIIKKDYNLIKEKVSMGLAHELSEADTIYLGAATKASSSKKLRNQPNSCKKAKSRAFSLKNSYMTYILNNYVIPNSKKEEKIIKSKLKEDFEEYILNKINIYSGSRTDDLIKELYNVNDSKQIAKMMKNKSIYSNLAFRMLGVKSNNAEEFTKANIMVKSIRVESDNRIIESMSFPSFNILELVEEKWEDSSIYNMFETTKFLFMIFKEDENKKGDYKFKNAFFWNMSEEVIESSLKKDWYKIRGRFISGVDFNPVKYKNNKVIVKNNLPKKKELEILEIRPHADKASYLIKGKKYGSGNLDVDSDLLPNGDRMTRQCFWLQNNFIKNVILKTM